MVSYNAVQRVFGSGDSFRSNDVCGFKAEHGQVEGTPEHENVSEDVRCPVVVGLKEMFPKMEAKALSYSTNPASSSKTLVWNKGRLFFVIEFSENGGEKKEADLHCEREVKKANEDRSSGETKEEKISCFPATLIAHVLSVIGFRSWQFDCL